MAFVLEHVEARGAELEGGVFAGGAGEGFLLDELVDECFECGRGVLGEDAEDGEGLVVELADAFGGSASEDIDDVAGAYALAGAGHGGDDLLGDDVGVGELFCFAEADVAGVAVWGGVFLAEVLDEGTVSAAGGVGERAHLREERELGVDEVLLDAGFGGGLFDESLPALGVV